MMLTKRGIILLTALMMILSLISCAAAEGEPSVKPGGVLEETDSVWGSYTYSAEGDLTIPDRISVMEGAKATLVLNGTLTAAKGIGVPEDAELVIRGSGKLIATGSRGSAGIGADREMRGGVIRIEGGTITATGGKGASGIGGGTGQDSGGTDIIISGGRITAVGSEYGSGLGGGTKNDSTGTVTISGGTVTADGGEGGAGIRSSNTIIKKGDVTATGHGGGAGIGARQGYNFGNKITIEGGKVDAFSDSGAGIGAGECGNFKSTGRVVISGGTVFATGGTYGGMGAAGIGSASDDTLFPASFEGTIAISGGKVYAYGGGYARSGNRGGAGIGAGYGSNAERGHVIISGGTVTANGGGGASGIGSGAKSSEGYGGTGCDDVQISGTAVVIARADGSGISAIGGGYGSSHAGKIVLADNMKAQAGNSDYQAVGADAREKTCQDYANARVEPCDHPEAVYSPEADGHTCGGCAYCKTQFEKEPHDYDPDTYICKICDYQGPLLTVTFDGNGGNGSMVNASVVPGKLYPLPECDYSWPDDSLRFGGWQIESEWAEDPINGVHPAKEEVQATHSFTAKAVWVAAYATVSFDANGGSGEMKPEVVPTDKKYPLPKCPFAPPEGMAFFMWEINGVRHMENAEVDITGDVTVKAIWVVVYGQPDFVLPAGTESVGENAFEGIQAHTVYIPNGCKSIGKHAFKDCPNLSRVAVPEQCEIGEDAFEGCALVYLFSGRGTPAEQYCATHENCVFLEEVVSWS